MNLLGRFLIFILIYGFFAVAVERGKFLELRNQESILRQSAVYATAALGMTMVIIAGGIDLSVGSVIALTMVIVAVVLNVHWEVPSEQGGSETVYLVHCWPRALPLLAVAAGVGAATLAGVANGLLVVGLRIMPFIVTLGTMSIFRGLTKRIAAERPVYPEETAWVADILDPTLTSSGPERWMLLPPGVWALLAAALLAALLLRYTRLGRHIFAVGSNEETARLCGISVGRTKIMVYAMAGFFAGMAGLMQFSWVGGSGQPSSAVGYELFVIAAVVIGGGSLTGGEGSILGALLGALTITVLSTGGELMGWRRADQEMLIGAILVAAVALDQLRRRRT